MAVTIKDVARVAGLSIATVSKYMNGGHVLDANREAIEQAISSLGYRVNVVARGLKTRRTMTVGVLIPSIEQIFSTGVIERDSCAFLAAAGYPKQRICHFAVVGADPGIGKEPPVRRREKFQQQPGIGKKTPVINHDQKVAPLAA